MDIEFFLYVAERVLIKIAKRIMFSTRTERRTWSGHVDECIFLVHLTTLMRDRANICSDKSKSAITIIIIKCCHSADEYKSCLSLREKRKKVQRYHRQIGFESFSMRHMFEVFSLFGRAPNRFGMTSF